MFKKYIKILALMAVCVAVFFVWSFYKKKTEDNSFMVSNSLVKGNEIITFKKEETAGKYYKSSINYLVDPSEKYKEVNSYINKSKSDFIKEVDSITDEDAKFMGLGGDRVYDLDVITGVSTSSNYISFYVSVYVFTGGAHGNTDINIFTYDNNGLVDLNKILSSSPLNKGGEVVLGNSFYNKLSAIARDYFYNKFRDVSHDDINMGIKPNQESFKTWYVSGDKIIFVFGQYSIGPYSIGIQEFPVKIDELYKMIN